MPPSLLEGEVQHLADYNFLIQTSPGKYQSNTIVWDLFELAVAGHRFWQDCAAEVADVHFDALMEVRQQVEDSGVYVPDGDYNFLLWTLLPKNIEEQSWRSMPAGETLTRSHQCERRRTIYCLCGVRSKPLCRPGFDMGSYVTFGPSLRYVEDTPLYLWQFNTSWVTARSIGVSWNTGMSKFVMRSNKGTARQRRTPSSIRSCWRKDTSARRRRVQIQCGLV